MTKTKKVQFTKEQLIPFAMMKAAAILTGDKEDLGRSRTALNAMSKKDRGFINEFVKLIGQHIATMGKALGNSVFQMDELHQFLDQITRDAN